jgi:hypothetical protein
VLKHCDLYLFVYFTGSFHCIYYFYPFIAFIIFILSLHLFFLSFHCIYFFYPFIAFIIFILSLHLFFLSFHCIYFFYPFIAFIFCILYSWQLINFEWQQCNCFCKRYLTLKCVLAHYIWFDYTISGCVSAWFLLTFIFDNKCYFLTALLAYDLVYITLEICLNGKPALVWICFVFNTTLLFLNFVCAFGILFIFSFIINDIYFLSFVKSLDRQITVSYASNVAE